MNGYEYELARERMNNFIAEAEQSAMISQVRAERKQARREATQGPARRFRWALTSAAAVLHLGA